MKVIARMAPGAEALLSQRDDDGRASMQKQSEIEVELFWSSIEHEGRYPVVEL
jgi:hypothetical protein